MMDAARAKSTAPMWVYVCPATVLSDGLGICALVGGRQVAVFRMPRGGRCYAIDNYDPFSGANVLSRGIAGDLKGQPVVASPIYKQHFNLQTGQCLEDESVHLDTFPVCVIDGMLLVRKPFN